MGGKGFDAFKGDTGGFSLPLNLDPNTGRAFRADKVARVAKYTVYLSATHPSHIVLPVYEAANEHESAAAF